MQRENFGRTGVLRVSVPCIYKFRRQRKESQLQNSVLSNIEVDTLTDEMKSIVTQGTLYRSKEELTVLAGSRRDAFSIGRSTSAPLRSKFLSDPIDRSPIERAGSSSSGSGQQLSPRVVSCSTLHRCSLEPIPRTKAPAARLAARCTSRSETRLEAGSKKPRQSAPRFVRPMVNLVFVHPPRCLAANERGLSRLSVFFLHFLRRQI